VGNRSCKFLKSAKNEKKFRSVEVLKLAVNPEKVLTFGQCGAEKFILPAC